MSWGFLRGHPLKITKDSERSEEYFEGGEKMNVYEAIQGRRTIRKFQEERRITLDTLKKLVNAARLAPSGANMQPWEFIVVEEKNICDAVFPHLRWAGYIAPAGNPPEGYRPTAYIVLLKNPAINKAGEHDIGAAAQNIMLAAYELGIASCWLGSIEREKVKSVLQVPQDYEIDTIVALGYPAEKSVIEKEEGSIKYYKDEQGTLHVPKRTLEKVMHINGYSESS